MTTNRVHGNNFGVQAGSVNGNVTIRAGRPDIDATTVSGGDDGVVNEVYGDNHGAQLGDVNGDLNFG